MTLRIQRAPLSGRDSASRVSPPSPHQHHLLQLLGGGIFSLPCKPFLPLISRDLANALTLATPYLGHDSSGLHSLLVLLKQLQLGGIGSLQPRQQESGQRDRDGRGSWSRRVIQPDARRQMLTKCRATDRDLQSTEPRSPLTTFQSLRLPKESLPPFPRQWATAVDHTAFLQLVQSSAARRMWFTTSNGIAQPPSRDHRGRPPTSFTDGVL